MENQFKIFQHKEFGKVRTVVIDGVAYFSGKDVTTALKYKDTDKAIRDHVDAEDKLILKPADLAGLRIDSTFSIDSPHGLMFINESSLYSLIISSKLPQAKEFKRWVTNEVLPAIRKTGSYSLPKVEKPVAVENQPPALHKLLDDINKSSKLMEEIFKVKNGIALAKSISVVEKINCVDLSEVKELLPLAEHEIGYIVIGKALK